MTHEGRQIHAELLLAAIRAEALSLRLSDKKFREYTRELTDLLDLPEAQEKAA